MKTLITSIFLLCTTGVWAQTLAPSLTIAPNEGMELVAIVHTIAGRTTPAPSRYFDEVKTYFKPYENHPAVLAAKNRAWYYFDIHEMGLSFDNFPNPTIAYLPDTWIQVMGGADSVRAYMTQLADFYRVSNFNAFYRANQPRYDTWGVAIKAEMEKEQVVQKLNQFYGKQCPVRWHIVLDPLNSMGAHALIPERVNPKLTGQVMYQLGYFGSKDSLASKKDPQFKADAFIKYNLTWHEGSHVLAKDIQKKHEAEINTLAPLLTKLDDEATGSINRQGVSTWPHYFDEVLVRAISMALYRQHTTPALYERNLCREVSSGFEHVKVVEEIISKQYLANRIKYPDFESFFPTLLANLKKQL